MSPSLQLAWSRSQRQRDRDALAVLWAIMAVGFALIGCAVGACGCSATPLTPQEQSDVANHAILLEHCKQVGRGVGPDGGIEAFYVCVDGGR